MLVQSRTLVTAILSCSLVFGTTVNGASVAIAQENVPMAALYEPDYESLETRLGSINNDADLPNSVSQSVENFAELPEGTRFVLDSDTFAVAVSDGVVTSRLDSHTGVIRHTFGGAGTISYNPGEVTRSYIDRVTVRVVYPDGSIDIVTPHSVVEVSDSFYYSVQSIDSQRVRNGQSIKVPMTVIAGDGAIGGVPQGAKVVRDRYGSVEDAELMGATIVIDEKTGELTFTAPDDRTGQMWFRTEVIYPDGTYSEVHYLFEVTDTWVQDDSRPFFGSSLSS